MNIGQASIMSKLSAKTIRYYEDIDLVKPDRQPNGYRDYTNRHLHCLKFLHRSRNLGFSIEECRKLLSLYDDKGRASADVKALAKTHLEDIELKILELQSLRVTLGQLVDACSGDDRPDCPILENMASDG